MIPKEQFEKAVSGLRDELSRFNTGRATPALVEDIFVDCYSAKSPLKQVAAISAPDSKTLLIQPWDPGITKNIEKAIHQAEIGLNPVNEGKTIRIIIPPMTEERRRDLVKKVHAAIESCRVHVRSIREELWKKLQKDKQAKASSEDEVFRMQKELQQTVDEYNKHIKEIGDRKEQEIMTI